MNKEQADDLKSMKKCIDENAEILLRIDKVLNGDREKDKYDFGLVGDVRNNQRWKNMVNKVLGGTGTISLGLLIKELFGILKKGG